VFSPGLEKAGLGSKSLRDWELIRSSYSGDGKAGQVHALLRDWKFVACFLPALRRPGQDQESLCDKEKV
jgi:hypothetical protein